MLDHGFIQKETREGNMENMLVGIFGLIMYTGMMRNVKWN
jgi:hypothetical protein